VLLKWLQRRIQLAAIKGGRQDLERFVISLRGQSDEEIGTLVAIAAVIRMRLREAGHLPDEMLQITSVHEHEQAATQLHMSRLVRTFQAERQFSDAAGVMVWLHTLRSLSSPELRLLGRQMWQQLERGFLHALPALAQIEAVTGRDLPLGTLQACRFIPDSLDPVELT
jgi:hypothetical protein